ncbi:hypothetical protein SAMN04488109_0990 [Chryseolinea serpens]|jgi:hypothetical protein|uniref:Protein CcmA, bactofilin family n=1 Tax=Chryseolinea serpens TaxID=947013 RepID=A0A1M5L3E2_9BACT|nr:hypothetical protein [Chryseolinea serpens]SHG59465.1 hypothetical protein SAMN04488109_0990 [Chryseolinea serpens]
MPKVLPRQKGRRIEFIGDFTNDSIVIGNYGDASLVARGNFNLSGLIYCGRNTVEMEIAGDGMIVFKGVCKKLMIKRVEGNCVIDLSDLTTQSVWCESARGKSIVTLGRTRTIELLSLDEDALVRYEGKPLLLNYSLRGNSKIENWKTDTE